MSVRPAGASASRPRATVTTVSTYTDLSRAVRDSGLLGRRLGWYWGRFLMSVGALLAIVAAVTALGDSWWQLVPAAALGVVLTQFGYLGHDAAHRQIFTSAPCNEWAARILSGAFAGLSHGWWRGKHNQHHAAPNQEGRDPDIAPGVLAFTRDAADARHRGWRLWFQRRQGWLFFPLLTLEGLNLHVASYQFLLGPGPLRHRRLELGLITARLMAYVVVLVLVLPVGLAAAFVAVQMAVFGLCLGGTFAPNHTGMPIVPRDAKIDFLHRQVLMSRNVRGGLVVDTAMGGLNYQIEHHLFPSMPRPNLRHAQPLVRAHCAEHEVPYTELGLWESYGVVVDYLNHVGLRARGPFDCPVAAQLRG